MTQKENGRSVIPPHFCHGLKCSSLASGVPVIISLNKSLNPEDEMIGRSAIY